MSEIAKRLEKAEKHLQKGKLSAALEEFRAVLAEDPTSDQARQRAADLALSLNLTDEATEYLNDLFDHTAMHGRPSEAVSHYKKLQRLGAVSHERTFRYAQLIEKTSPREAVEAFRTSFNALIAEGNKHDALVAIKHMVAIEPSPENLRQEAELAESMGDRESAAASLFQLGKLEESSGRDASSVYAQAYGLDRRNPAITLAYARCLLAAEHAEEAVQVLQVQTIAVPEYTEMLAHALLKAKRIGQAEPLVTRLYEHDEKALALVGEVITAYAHAGQNFDAIRFARSLETKAKQRGSARELLNLIRDVSDKNPTDLELLDYLAQLYNSSNREHEYCATLLKLFELHYAQRNFIKAADCLDRASEVDAYEPGHEERLAMLRGKIDASRYSSIQGRLASVARTTTKAQQEAEPQEANEKVPEKTGEPTILEDLMLQAEIFLQYSMRSKAVERLERINKLFPREEDQNEKLAQLYVTAGFTPKYDSAKPPTAAAADKTAAAAAANESAVDNFARVTEITRNIARQSSVKAVLFATVNDVGRHWNVSRCVAGLVTPGKPPSAAMEYCATGVPKSDVMGLAKLLPGLQAQTVKANGPVSFERAQTAAELESIRSVLIAQKIESLLTVPLIDGDEPIGIVILEQCGGQRAFTNVDEVVLNTIAEQVVLAVNNAKLRSMVKNMGVTDERSGLMRRSSYLDVLLSEVQRNLQQRTPISLLLMNFGSASALVKEVGEERVEEAMQEIGHLITSHIRQNDIAVRYDLTSIALVLTDTNDKSAFFVLDKLRKALTTKHMPGNDGNVNVTTGIAELVMQPRYDPVDIVTEAINRVENALEMARHEGGDRAHSLAAMNEVSVVSA